MGRDSVPRALDCTSRRKLFVLDLLVALEGDAPDHRIFDHGHQEVATDPG